MTARVGRSRVAWGIAGLDIVAFLVATTFDPQGDVVAGVLYLVGIASFAGVGALLCTRVPANPIGVLLLAAGTLLVAAIVIGTYADFGALQVPPWPGSGVARLVGDTIFIYPFVIALIGIPLVFPDGRLPSRRFRWVVRITIANMVAWTLGGILGPTPGGAPGAIPGLAALDPFFEVLQPFVLVATLVSFGGAVVAVRLRFRRGDPVQRQQVKWLVAVVGVGAVVLPVALVLYDVNPGLADALSSVAILAMFALPIAIGIAILRYRLYEIDRLVSRTIGWAVVSGLLIAVFAGGVMALQTMLAGFTQGQTLAVAASTLVAFALFQPLRRRVQRAVDRRFDRARYDGEQTAAAFAERLRDQVDLGGLESDITGTVGVALRPSSAGIWIRQVVPVHPKPRIP
jgi:hypothetical protein